MGRFVQTTVGGLPCTIERKEGEWLVTVASVSVAKGTMLNPLLVRASGGRIDHHKSAEIATAVIHELNARGARLQ